QTDTVQSADPLTQNDAVGLGVDKGLMFLAVVELDDVGLCIQQSLYKIRVGFRQCIIDLIPADFKTFRKFSVKFQGIIPDSRYSFFTYPRKYLPDRLGDLFIHFGAALTQRRKKLLLGFAVCNNNRNQL